MSGVDPVNIVPEPVRADQGDRGDQKEAAVEIVAQEGREALDVGPELVPRLLDGRVAQAAGVDIDGAGQRPLPEATGVPRTFVANAEGVQITPATCYSGRSSLRAGSVCMRFRSRAGRAIDCGSTAAEHRPELARA
jgi:hypothetical protein